MSQDPLGFDAGDSNLYRYVRNAVTHAEDPSGLITIYFDGVGQSENSNTIVNRMFQKTEGEKYIFRFPELLRGEEGVTPEVKDALAKITAAIKKNEDEPIYIIGWSRGGVAAILLSKEIQKTLKGREIQYVGVVDPVAEGLPPRSVVSMYPNSKKILDNPRQLGELPRMKAQFPGNIAIADVFSTPPIDGPYDTIPNALMDKNNRVKFDLTKGSGEAIAVYPGIGHAHGGFDGKVGWDLWERASDAGVPLSGKNPFNPPPQRKPDPLADPFAPPPPPNVWVPVKRWQR
jgi:hypothetical protein